MSQPHHLSATFFYSIGGALILGYILVVGQGVIVPVVVSLIGVIVLARAVEFLRQLALFKTFPSWLLHVFVLALALIAATAFGWVVAVTLEQMMDRAPTYQSNLEVVIQKGASIIGLEAEASWDDVRGATLDRLNLTSIVGQAVGSIASFGGALLLVVVYSAFLMGEFAKLPAKVQSAYSEDEGATRILEVVGEISRKVADYLSAKTGINVLLGLISFVVLWFFGVDFAVFWAICIALLNYIPYIGSAVGVALPVVLSVAQFGDLWTSLFLTIWLAVAQVFVGNVLEPRWIGRQLNLSPFSIILALAVWSSLWGIAGAILAIPLTSVLTIVFREIPGTRPIAVFISDVPATGK